MLNKVFIDAGDIFESKTFNLLSKKSEHYIERISEAMRSEANDNPEGKEFGLTPDEKDLNEIEKDVKKVCSQFYKPGITDTLIKTAKAAGADYKFLEKYSDPKKLAKQNIKCFLQTILLYTHYKDELDRVYRRYLTVDDFGEVNREKAFKKIAEFLKNNMDSDLGSIPLEDCIKYIACVCEAFYQAPLHSNEIDTSLTQKNNGLEYERLCFSILDDAGYITTETPPTGDYGADLIATKDELTFCIQCKDHAKPIGVSAIQQASSAKDYYECDFAVVATESKFTDAALKMANKLNVICLVSTELPKLVDKCSGYI